MIKRIKKNKFESPKSAQFYLGSEIKGAALRNAIKLSDNDLNKDGAEDCTQLRAARETFVFSEGDGEEPRRHSERRAESKGARSCAKSAFVPPAAGTAPGLESPAQLRARRHGFAKREAARAPGSGAPSLAPNKAETITFAYGRATRQTGAAFAAASDPSAPPRPRTARPPGAPRQPRNADRPRPGPPPPGPAPPTPVPPCGAASRGRHSCGRRRGAPLPLGRAGTCAAPRLLVRGPSPALGLPRSPRTAATRSSPRRAPRGRRSPTGRGGEGTGAAAQAQVRLRQPGPSLWRRGSAPPAAVAVATPAPGGRAPAPRAGNELRVHRAHREGAGGASPGGGTCTCACTCKPFARSERLPIAHVRTRSRTSSRKHG